MVKRDCTNNIRLTVLQFSDIRQWLNQQVGDRASVKTRIVKAGEPKIIVNKKVLNYNSPLLMLKTPKQRYIRHQHIILFRPLSADTPTTPTFSPKFDAPLIQRAEKPWDRYLFLSSKKPKPPAKSWQKNLFQQAMFGIHFLVIFNYQKKKKKKEQKNKIK